MVGWLINDKLEIIWKEGVVERYPGICLKELRKPKETSVMKAGVPVDVRT
jgi:hypothetical protein